jgi:hypothetical protein
VDKDRDEVPGDRSLMSFRDAPWGQDAAESPGRGLTSKERPRVSTGTGVRYLITQRSKAQILLRSRIVLPAVLARSGGHQLVAHQQPANRRPDGTGSTPALASSNSSRREPHRW